MNYHFRKVSNLAYVVKRFTRKEQFIAYSKQSAYYLHQRASADKSDSDIMAKSVGEHHNFPKEEEGIIELWKKLDAFKTSLKQSEGKPRYDKSFFYETNIVYDISS